MVALDRQHLRNLFGVCDLLANEEIDNNLRKGFVVYVIRHNRPLAEILAPTRRDFSHEFKRSFLGIIERPITPGELVQTREHLICVIVGQLRAKHREFLVRFERDEPGWSLIELADVNALPAVRSYMQNLAWLNSKKRQELIAAHHSALGVGAG